MDISLSTNIINSIEKRRYNDIKCFNAKVFSLVFVVVVINGRIKELMCIHVVE